jgi:hypothetical protein
MWNLKHKAWEINLEISPTTGIYELFGCDGLSWHPTHTKFHEDWYRRSSNIKMITVLLLVIGGIYELPL